MKNIFLLLAFIGLAFASCKKSSPTPTPQPIVTAPLDTTGGNDTTSVDTTAVAIRFSLTLGQLVTANDYKHSISNVSIYLKKANGDTTKLVNSNYDLAISGNGDLVGISNDTVLGSTKPYLHANKGDSLIVIVDSLEFNNGTAISNRIYNTGFVVYQNNNKTTVFSSTSNWTNYASTINDYVTNNLSSNRPLGLYPIPPTSNPLVQWYLGGRFKLFFKIQ